MEYKPKHLWGCYPSYQFYIMDTHMLDITWKHFTADYTNDDSCVEGNKPKLVDADILHTKKNLSFALWKFSCRILAIIWVIGASKQYSRGFGCRKVSSQCAESDGVILNWIFFNIQIPLLYYWKHSKWRHFDECAQIKEYTTQFWRNCCVNFYALG